MGKIKVNEQELYKYIGRTGYLVQYYYAPSAFGSWEPNPRAAIMTSQVLAFLFDAGFTTHRIIELHSIPDIYAYVNEHACFDVFDMDGIFYREQAKLFGYNLDNELRVGEGTNPLTTSGS